MAGTERHLCDLAWRLTAAMALDRPVRVILHDGQGLHGRVESRHAAEDRGSPWLIVTVAGHDFDVRQVLEVAVS